MAPRRVLTPAFFDRDALLVGRELLGKYLVRRVRGKTRAYRIVETESYIGPDDKASHAHKGRTKRTEVMFGPPGRWYVYFVYGMHEMLNIVTGKKEYPAAILIRGVEEAIGPGRLTKRLEIGRELNGKPASKSSGLWIEDRGEKVPLTDIEATPRIGVAYAKEWAAKPYRFVLREFAKRPRTR